MLGLARVRVRDASNHLLSFLIQEKDSIMHSVQIFNIFLDYGHFYGLEMVLPLLIFAMAASQRYQTENASPAPHGFRDLKIVDQNIDIT